MTVPRLLCRLALAGAFAAVGLTRPASCAEGPPILADLEGTWVSTPALLTIETARSGHAFPLRRLEFVLSTESGIPGRLFWTDGRDVSWRALKEVAGKEGEGWLVVGPWEVRKPAAKEWSRVRFRIERDLLGRAISLSLLDREFRQDLFEIPLLHVQEPLATRLNRVILAGTYRDIEGRTWEFTETGQARWPERRFPYEISLDATGSDCAILFTPERGQPGNRHRWGYRWERGLLLLFEVAYDSPAMPIHCMATPIAELRRVSPGH